MFGYAIANLNKLTTEEMVRYRSCYCGLCRSLGQRHGTISRITLTYDMTLLILVLTDLYETTGGGMQSGRCIAHPLKRHEFWQNEFTDYAADMNVALAHYNFLDDWNDSGKLLSLCEAKLFEREYGKISTRHPEQCKAIEKCLAELICIEKAGVLHPDIPADCFGTLLGEIFVPRRDRYNGELRAFGKALGKFIYIMDACLDLKGDIEQERYNPMVATPSENFPSILNLLMADCTEKFGRLPVGRDRKLIENILYSGVWTRYEAGNRKNGHKTKANEKDTRVKKDMADMREIIDVKGMKEMKEMKEIPEQ